ncbi:MAG TPA: hypothetical protein VGX23_18480 [Actinocrinis sp.]|nr:hypothetical protein [Actinocrinis sp.]
MQAATSIPGTPVDLNTTGHYLTWGVLHISVANLIIVLVIGALFTAALVLPFPKGRGRR